MGAGAIGAIGCGAYAVAGPGAEDWRATAFAATGSGLVIGFCTPGGYGTWNGAGAGCGAGWGAIAPTVACSACSGRGSIELPHAMQKRCPGSLRV